MSKLNKRRDPIHSKPHVAGKKKDRLHVAFGDFLSSPSSSRCGLPQFQLVWVANSMSQDPLLLYLHSEASLLTLKL